MPPPAVPMRLSFTVPGEAVPQGSMKAFTPKGWTRPVLTSDNVRMKPWRAMVVAAALDAQVSQGTWPCVSDQPIELQIACYFTRPKSVSAKKRPHMIVKPDSSKLLRAIEDALTSVLWRDDSQIVSTTVTKAYAEPTEPACVDLVIRELPPALSLQAVRPFSLVPIEGQEPPRV